MKIFFDHQTFSQQEYGGISRYFCELITGINQRDGYEANLSLLWSNNVNLSEYNISRLQYPFPKKHHLLQLSNQVFNYLDLKTRRFDLYHTTYYDPFFIGSIGRKPYVVTYYDMIHEKYERQYSNLVATSQLIDWKKRISHSAAALLAISESTKRDMVEWLNVAPDRIHVTHLANSLHPAVVAQPDMGAPYILYVGNRSIYKNFQLFLSSVSQVLTRYGLRLVCAGGGKFSTDETNHIAMLGLTHVVEQHPVNDQILAQLYGRATAFVFPSLYEGFGIPILEAMACGCPCLLSNRSSLPEVGGDAAVYFEPEDADSIKSSLTKLLDDTLLRAEMVERGLVRESHFSWRKTVDQTLFTYNKLT